MGKGGEAEKEWEEGAAKIEGARGVFEVEERIVEVKGDFEGEGRVTEGGGLMTEEMGVEVLLLLRYRDVAALVVAVAPTEHICTGIYQERYIWLLGTSSDRQLVSGGCRATSFHSHIWTIFCLLFKMDLLFNMENRDRFICFSTLTGKTGFE